MKIKPRNHMDVKDDMHVALSKTVPQIQDLSAKLQKQYFHWIGIYALW